MNIVRNPVVLVSCLLGALVTACTAGSQGDDSGHSTVVSAKDFSLSRFEDPTEVNNKWFPLEPGTQWVYEGSALDEGEHVARRVVSTVTDLTKEVAGLRTVVLWERDYDDGELVETELAFFAEDTAGNVWHLGEYPEEWEDGEFDKAPAWIEGQKGAKAGLAMKAQPRLGTPDYAQGFAPAPLYWDDRARVYKTGYRTCVPVDCYENVLVMEEFERRIPGAFQDKYYAPGVGGVRVAWHGAKEEEREELTLVDLRNLNGESLVKVREQALALEKRAYEISKVYRATQPAVPAAR
jgi:hypothetical protein